MATVAQHLALITALRNLTSAIRKMSAETLHKTNKQTRPMKQQSNDRKVGPWTASSWRPIWAAPFQSSARWKAASILVLLVMTFVPCRAALLAYEGFDYTAGGDLMGLSGGAGWSGGWQAVQGGAGVLINTGSLDATGISPSGYAARATGNSALVNNGHRSGRFLDCSAGGTFGSHGYIDGNGRIGAGGKVLYISFLQQGTETGDYYEFEFHRDNLDDPGRIGGVCGQGDIYLRTPNNTIHIVNADTALHFFVIKVVFNANGNDDFYVYNDPTGTAESDNAPTLVATGQGNFSFNGISISAFGGSVNHFSDQIRLGETWTDVVGGPAGFTLQPGTVIANVGDAAPLTAQAVSDLAINYQWYKNGSLLSGATATTLSFPSLALSDNGNYTLVASNALGSATSTVAAVTVINTNNDTLLVYEGFSYSAGPLIGQNGGAGWSGAWEGPRQRMALSTVFLPPRQARRARRSAPGGWLRGLSPT